MKTVIFFVLLASEAFAKNLIFNFFNNIRGNTWKNGSVTKRANITDAIKDMATGLPTSHITLLFDNFMDMQLMESLFKALYEDLVTTSAYMIDNEQNQEKFCQDTRNALKKYENVVNIIFSKGNAVDGILWLLQQHDLVHRKALYMFYFDQLPENGFYIGLFEAMRVAIVLNSQPGIYRVYYNQAGPSGTNALTLINWWSLRERLFRLPLLPPAELVYQNFQGRLFQVPVLHKPPWNFVEYTNSSFKPNGGRDDKLLTVIAQKLNFRYNYIDPPERLQGYGIAENGSFPGVLGQVWQRDVDFFMGDVTITYDRAQAVEFSFFTLVDSEAFVTHRPSKLNEALALIRPFQWQVWSPILATFILYGPVLFAIIELPNFWMKIKYSKRKRKKLFWDCVWFSTSTFLRQGGIQPSESHRVRLVSIIVSLGATYVIGDMYSANLTSLLARPGRENPITVLEQLEVAMYNRGYELLVEKHSSSFSTLQNGTGVYERIWEKMQTQRQYVTDSIESGMKLVRKRKNIALLGGRETLYFDIKRFGSYNFHLSEKLNTRYSAIAMQIGCPYIENFNRIIMQLFEGGILTKMTEEEYEKLGEMQRTAAANGETEEQVNKRQEEIQTKREFPEQTHLEAKGGHPTAQHKSGLDAHRELQPLNIKMLQGAFYILIFGYISSGLILVIEISTAKAGNTRRHKPSKISYLKYVGGSLRHRGVASSDSLRLANPS